MKKELILIISLLTAVNSFAQSGFILRGNITGTDGKKIYLYHSKDGKQLTDSTISKNGQFSFTGNTSVPSMYRIGVEGNRAMFQFLAENKDMEVRGDIAQLGKLTISGSTEDLLYRKMVDVLIASAPSAEVIKQYQELQKNKDTDGMKKIDDDYNKKRDDAIAEITEIIQKNTEKFAPAFVLSNYLMGSMKDDMLKNIFDSFSNELKISSPGKIIQKHIETSYILAIGKTAPDFEQNDTEGKPLKLSALRGKYVLVDFWASWCKPCREENPNVVKNYQAHKDKNFTVLGISLDQPGQKERWVKAIADDQLTWYHVSDLKFWENAVAVQYNIRSIPQNLLIGPDGKILAKNLRGDALTKQLNELIK